MVNAAGEAVLVKYHWKTQQGIESLTQEQADAIQATDLGSASADAYAAIESGEYPRWELNVQIMSDDEHPELDFDPLDDTKTWPEDEFPLLPVGMMTLDENVKNHFAENEQIAFGTGVLVDGLEFSDDKMLVGRTFSYSDTQRYRVGPNYLQLPVNQPAADVQVNTNQRDGQMAYNVDGHGGNPHVNYEPSGHDGLNEAEPNGAPYEPYIEGRLTRAPIERTNDYAQAGERYRTMPDWEREDLVLNLVTLLSQAQEDVQDRMLVQLRRCDEDYGRRVAEGLGRAVEEPVAG
jgi:catalase